MRPITAPPFEIEGNLVKVPPGEVFCRMPIGADGDMCPNSEKKLSPAGLLQHVRAHSNNGEKIIVANRRVGALGVQMNSEMVLFWNCMKDFIEGRTPVVPKVPTRLNPQSPSTTPKQEPSKKRPRNDQAGDSDNFKRRRILELMNQSEEGSEDELTTVNCTKWSTNR
ncbi:hypothetical protein GGS26DRAFT_591798 [Hypomontagnella submonticulosa]|nr:hypothetical protein GGS26DRAFT_591798 [Hypomontagnella submonticulosa]